MPDGHYALNLDSTTFPHEDPSAREHPEKRGGAKHPESNPPKLFVTLPPL